MNYKEMKKKLLQFYKEPSVYKILDSTRKPRYEVMLDLYKNENVPFEAWLDIKKWLRKQEENMKKKG